MKKYIGTEEVKATPMKANEAKKQGYKVGSYVNEDGYEVEYADGYKSWFPEDVFERIYKLSERPLDRMRIESDQLCEKFSGLGLFIESEKFKELDAITQAMLKVQFRMMCNYWQILNHRFTKMESGIGGSCSLNFGQAIEYLKAGCAIRRYGWNGKGLFVVKQIPAHIESDIIPKMQSLPQSAKDLILKGKGFIDYTSQCLIINENTGVADSWVPSISDVFAEDWDVIL